MPTKDPKFWAIVGTVCALISGGGTVGINWAVNDLVEYRLSQHEKRLVTLEEKISLLPPKPLLGRIRDLERFVDRHDHPDSTP